MRASSRTAVAHDHQGGGVSDSILRLRHWSTTSRVEHEQRDGVAIAGSGRPTDRPATCGCSIPSTITRQAPPLRRRQHRNDVHHHQHHERQRQRQMLECHADHDGR